MKSNQEETTQENSIQEETTRAGSPEESVLEPRVSAKKEQKLEDEVVDADYDEPLFQDLVSQERKSQYDQFYQNSIDKQALQRQ